MRVRRTRRWTRGHSLRFEGLAELHARTWPRLGPQHGEPPRCGAVACPRTGSVRSLDDCLHCEHFVNLRPEPGGTAATLRCLVCDDDPLPRRARGAGSWQVVAPDVAAATARLYVWASGAGLLVVAEGNEVRGVVHAGALQDAAGTVGELMIEEPWSLSPVATIGDAVEAMRTLHVPGMLVVDGDRELLGVVSAGDLRRLGVSPELLGR